MYVVGFFDLQDTWHVIVLDSWEGLYDISSLSTHRQVMDDSFNISGPLHEVGLVRAIFECSSELGSVDGKTQTVTGSSTHKRVIGDR